MEEVKDVTVTLLQGRAVPPLNLVPERGFLNLAFSGSLSSHIAGLCVRKKHGEACQDPKLSSVFLN